MINPIYIYFAIAWTLLVIGFYIKEFTMSALASIILIVLGVYGLANGIGGLNNLLTLTISIIHICLGAYVLIRGAIEMMIEYY